jgi:23S rRNA (adenine2503-C2)-methyltransferase
MQEELKNVLLLRTTEIADVQHSLDGTEKYAIRLADGNIIEAVWIPMGRHATVCISSQVGCPVQCRFCASGADGLIRNLSAGEIVEQVWHICAAHPGSDSLNIVVMGIGEPLYNYDAVSRALSILHDAEGLNIGWRRMTVSTTGVLHGITALASDAPQVNLAVSLHAPTDEQREKIIAHCPSNIRDLLVCLQEYYQTTHRNITYEYILLDGINDTHADAVKLASLTAAVPAKVNLIPYNTVPHGTYRPSPRKQVEQFAEWLEIQRVPVMIRRRKGDDIAGACGQLRQQTLEEE